MIKSGKWFEMLALTCVVAIFAMMAGVAAAQKSGMGAEGLATPLEYYTNGNIKTMLTAKTARIAPDGTSINGTGVVYRIFDEDGRTNVSVIADDCSYNKTDGTANSESNVRIEKEGALITGKGFSLDSKKEHAVIKSEVRVVIPAGFKLKLDKKGKDAE